MQPVPGEMVDRRSARPGRWRLSLLVIAVLQLVACAGGENNSEAPATDQPPTLEADVFRTADGTELPLRVRGADADAQADVVVLALHGFLDYGGNFDVLADALEPYGVRVYAYDQRGFGAAPQPGEWPGDAALIDDAQAAARLLRERYPDKPLYLVGKSMGAAVAIRARVDDPEMPVDGSVLISPAVWGAQRMPWYQRVGLWLGDRLMPWAELSRDLAQWVGSDPTDDPDVLAAMEADPLVQEYARIGTLEALADFMDAALDEAADLPGPALILYGMQDKIIPVEPVCLLLERLPHSSGPAYQVVLYPDGYHMLTRYTGKADTEADITAWLRESDRSVPSGRAVAPMRAYGFLCGD